MAVMAMIAIMVVITIDQILIIPLWLNEELQLNVH
jgi:hypothetical protein